MGTTTYRAQLVTESNDTERHPITLLNESNESKWHSMSPIKLLAELFDPFKGVNLDIGEYIHKGVI